MRRQISSKSNTCTEGMDVYAAGISVKVGAHYPGRSVDLPCASGIDRCWEGSSEVSRGYSRSSDRTEGPSLKYGVGALNFDDQGDAEGRVETPGAATLGSGRKSRGGEDGASRITARRGHSHPEKP